jgi:hypothetical protein
VSVVLPVLAGLTATAVRAPPVQPARTALIAGHPGLPAGPTKAVSELGSIGSGIVSGRGSDTGDAPDAAGTAPPHPASRRIAAYAATARIEFMQIT